MNNVYNTSRPTKEAVRAWFKSRVGATTPVPTPRQIQAALNWHLQPKK